MSSSTLPARTLADLDWPWPAGRLALRPALPGDAATIWPWYSSQEVQHWTTTWSRTPEDHERRWETTLAQTIVGELERTIIAVGTLKRQDAWSQTEVAEQARGTQAEVGWVLDPAHHGRGHGTAFAAGLLEIAFDGLGVRRVEAGCFAQNLPSRRVMEKVGMRCEGVFREESLHRSGEWMDGMSYALLASEHRAAATSGDA